MGMAGKRGDGIAKFFGLNQYPGIWEKVVVETVIPVKMGVYDNINV
jgi:hypothetical protein